MSQILLHAVRSKIDYRLLRPLGDGHFGRVFEAAFEREGPASRHLALKVYKRGKFPEKRLAAFRDQEFAMGIRVRDHRHVVEVLDSDWGMTTLGLRAYLLMELVPGHDLKEIFQRQPRHFDDEYIEVGDIEPRQLTIQLLHGLNALHEVELLHLDVKPANIVINRSQELKLVDLGSASPQNAPVFYEFLPVHAAPELTAWTPGKIGPWSDLFSLGCVLEDFQKAGGVLPRDLNNLRRALLRQNPWRRPRTTKEALALLD